MSHGMFVQVSFFDGGKEVDVEVKEPHVDEEGSGWPAGERRDSRSSSTTAAARCRLPAPRSASRKWRSSSGLMEYGEYCPVGKALVDTCLLPTLLVH